jgi:enoyl-CoA hydratase
MTDVSSRLDGSLFVVTIDRPDSRNAISQDVMRQLEGVLDDVEGSSAAALLLRGGGDRAFVSGGDLKDLAALTTHAEAAAMARRMRGLLDRVARLSIPTIAALNGHALGGGAEVALSCDVRVAADDVSIAFNQSVLAIMPAWGGVERLVGLVGRSRALELLLGGQRLQASEARGIGLVNIVVPRADFDRESLAYARRLAGMPASVTRHIKGAVDAAEANLHPHLESAAVDRFADLWVAPEHWQAVDRMSAARAANNTQVVRAGG